MATQDELAMLFARNLSLQNQYVAPPVVVVEDKAPEPQPIVYSITQHYHHSNHVVSHQPSRPSSEPPQTDQLTAEIILSRHGVDSAALFPSQLDLFKSADAGQQMRLIELWRICPPNYAGITHDVGGWQSTSFAQEEAMAKLRYERQMLEERMSRIQNHQMESTEDTMSDDSLNAPLTPIQGGDGRWASSSAEPYMTSGYEMLAAREYEQSASQPAKDVYSHFGTAVGGPKYNPATDPVYKSGGDWHIQQQQSMENQYGAYQQNYHSWGGAYTGVHGDDEEML